MAKVLGFNFYISFLEHPDREVRQNIVYLLYCIRDHSKRLLPILKDHLKIETDEEVREEMKRILMFPKR